MTQSHPAKNTANRCAGEGELLWNVSLLPVSRPRPPDPTLVVVIELPVDRDRAIQEAIRRRNAA